MRLILLVVVASVTTISPLRGQGRRDTADSAAAEAIRARLGVWVEQTNRGDRRSAQTVWAPGSVCWFPGSPVFRDSAAASVAGVSYGGSGASSTYQLTIDEIAVAGEIAVVHDRWTETRHFPGSSGAARRLIRGSELWRRQPDGSWRIARCVSAPEQWQRDGAGAQGSANAAPATPGTSGLHPYLVALSVADVRAMHRWYREALGFRSSREPYVPAPGVVIGFLENDGFHLELVQRDGSRRRVEALPDSTDEISLHGFVKLGFAVADVDSALAALAARGVRPFFGPANDTTFRVRHALIRDPERNVIQLFQPLP